jgi:DNA (cytosine-5)-methyltransferase 1
LLRNSNPRWLLLENVPFMLSLDRGQAMHVLTRSLRELGFRWAYRKVDTLAFGLPQRRQRVLLLASRTEDPRDVLLADDAGESPPPENPSAYGFYWTEGLGGLGWAIDAVPTLKGGSTIGIPSSPGIWIPETGELVTPDIRDAERMQGFPADWTLCAVDDPSRKNTPRWKLVGNAVSVPVAAWLGKRLRRPGRYEPRGDIALSTREKWPDAAWSDENGRAIRTVVSRWPERVPSLPIREFLQYPTAPLSKRAAAGFFSRMERSTLRFDPRFYAAVSAYVARLQ